MKEKNLSSFLQLTCTFPEYSPPVQRPAPPSGRPVTQTALWQGFCVETFIFSGFVLSVVISKSSLSHVSQDDFSSASLPHSTHFCCQNSEQVLFILDVQKSYPTMQWPLLSDVLLSLVPSGLSPLFPLWHVPIKLQALWGKELPFFYVSRDTYCFSSAWIIFFSFCICNRPSCSLHNFGLPLQMLLYC